MLALLNMIDGLQELRWTLRIVAEASENARTLQIGLGGLL